MKSVVQKVMLRLLCLAIGVTLLSFPAFSQTANGRLSGTVKDQTGGAIVGAAVTVTDTARGLTRNLTTDEAGAFLAPNLIPGNYTVHATFTGFQAWERTNIALGVAQDLAIDIVLQPGAQTQTITITEELPLVNTTSSTLGGTLNNQTITDLPISGRNYVNLLELRPGTVLTLGNDSNGGGSASTNGLRSESSNSYAIEGLSGIDPYTGQSVTNLIGVDGDAATLLPLDAIQEFNQQFNAKAEYGSKAGSNVAVGLKSGTNSLHGTAYGFFRDTSTDALNYYNPYDTVNGVKTPIDIGGSLRQFGATAGGPIKKDKMFFFLGYEQEHLEVGSPRAIEAFFTDPGMLNCTGANATYACTPKAGLFPNIQGGTGVPDASNDLTLACLALRNAGMTPSTQSLFMVGMDSFCQLPGGTSASGQTFAAGHVNPDFFVDHGANDHGSQGPNNPDINTFFPNNNTTVLALGSVAKYDYTVNDKNSLNAFYYQGYGQRYDGLGAQPSDRYRTDFTQYARMVAGTWTYLPNSSVANSFRVGYSSLNEPDYGLDEKLGLSAGQLGFNTGVTRAGQLGVAQTLTPSGFYAIGSRETDLQGPGRSLEISDALSYLLGKHSLKVGASMIHDSQDISINAFGRGTWTFGLAANNSAATSGLVSFLLGQQALPANVGSPAPATSGNQSILNSGGGVANTIVRANTASAGARNTGLQSAQLLYGDPFGHATRYNFALFVQDDWRVKQKLTLNLGLRYDYSTSLKSKNGFLGSFDPNAAGGLIQEGVNTTSIYNPPTHSFGPRLGFAYDVFGNGKTVVRGGAGIVFDLITLRTYLEVGNDQGLLGVPTGFVTGCAGPPTFTVDSSGTKYTVNAIPSGTLSNCSGQLTTPGGSRKVGSVAWSATNQNIIGNILWDRPSPNTQTIFPDPNSAVLNCNPLISTKDTPTSTPRVGPTCGIPAIDRNIRQPYVETWTFGIQQGIGGNILLDVAYVGNHGVGLLDKKNLNQPFTFSGWLGSPTALAALKTCQQKQDSGDCTPSGEISTTNASVLRPYWNKFPWMADITQVVNGDTSNYDGLQTSVTVRNYHGLSAVMGYTWSHALSIQDNNNGGFETDSYNLPLDYGAAGADLRHRFSVAPTYSIPGRKGMYGLLDGWKLNGTYRFQTGRPLSYTTGTDFAGTNRGTSRWDLTGTPSDFTVDYAANVGNLRNPKLAQYWPGCTVSLTVDTSADCSGAGELPAGINPRTGVAFVTADLAVNNAACAKAAAGNINKQASLRSYGCWTEGNSALTPPGFASYGNTTKNMFRGLNFWQVDASLVKRQKITERFSGEFRFEVFNVLNHDNFAQPSGTIGTACSTTSCGFQTITATPDVSATNPIIGTGGPRRLQFGAKIIF